MSTFKSALTAELRESQFNNFELDNFDKHRFGQPTVQTENGRNLLDNIKQFIKKVIGYDKTQQNQHFEAILNKSYRYLDQYEYRLQELYDNVHPGSKELIVKIIAYRLLGFSKVKLPFNNSEYWESLELVKTLKVGDETYDPHFMHFILDKFDLTPIGYDIKLFFSEVGIAIDFVAEQYAYKLDGETIVQAKKGDVVFDIGGCWGDTALYFANRAGSEGKVYSFEFIPDNVKLHNINTDLNSSLKERIVLVPNPVSNISGMPVYYKDNGPGSKIELQPFENQTGSASTISIDDFVTNNQLQSVDFIKMDIEGAETLALEGAIQTIKKFMPVLAIAIYHSMDDLVNIPKWISSLNLDYELYIGHYTIHEEETICFAKSKRR